MGRKLTNKTNALATSGQPSNAMLEYAPRQRKKLLIIDDDRCMREGAAMFLAGSGYACTIGESATAAIDHLERDRFDLIITDLHMPDIDGIVLLDWVKSRWPKTKVMIITGDTDARKKKHAIKKGADNYLMKPFTLDRFLNEVDECFIHHRPGRESYEEVVLSKAVSCLARPLPP